MRTRKELLEALIDSRFDGNQKRFAAAIGRSPGQVNQWMTGFRNIGDGVARHIEMKLRLGEGYFDGRSTGVVGEDQAEYITDDEKALLDSYRHLSKEAKAYILTGIKLITPKAKIDDFQKTVAKTKRNEQAG